MTALSSVRTARAVAAVAAMLAAVGCTPVNDVPATPSPSGSALPSWAPDTPLILAAGFTGAGGGVYVLDLEDGDAVRIATDVPGVHKHPAWSPDGQSVVFIDETSERMFVAHLDGTPTTSIPTCDEPGCDYPAFSPDGTQIAFSRHVDAAGTIGPASVGLHVVDLATDEVREVVTLSRPLLADRPRWSPDGSQIVFGVDQMDDQANETGAAVAVVDAAGGEPRFLTDFELFGYSPDWGPDGRIAFSNDIRDAASDFDPTTEAWDVFTIDVDGSGLTKITDAAAGQQIQSPRWTPDGTGITAYDRSLPGGVLIDPTTGASTPLPTGRDLARPQLRPLP